jgi:UDP-2,3-diacylglucosamine pyrophosphatase LpxH
MLVVVSDLHLTDESTSTNVHPKAISKVLLRETIQNAKDNAREIRLVLLGDTFDFVRSDYWIKDVPPNERPWNGTLSSRTGTNIHPNVELHYRNVLDRILRTKTSKALFRAIISLRQRSAKGGRRKIPVRVTIVVGNHDRALNAFPSLRRRIAEQAKEADRVEFATELRAPEYGVLARHGHEWDDQCYGYEFYTKVLNKRSRAKRFHKACYKVQTIGEVVTAELMAGLVHRVREEIGSSNPEFIRQLMEVNNVRPQIDAFWWLEWFGRTYLNERKKAILLQALKDSIAAVLNTTLAERWDDLIREFFVFRGDLTDRLGQLLMFLEDKTFDQLKLDLKLFNFFRGIFGSSKDDSAEGARKEWEHGLPGQIQYVVYGHTHEARTEYFSGLTDNRVRMYINTGTYLPLIQRARDVGFAMANQMTMTFFYRGDEDTDGKKDGMPSMEMWNGIKRKFYDR